MELEEIVSGPFDMAAAIRFLAGAVLELRARVRALEAGAVGAGVFGAAEVAERRPLRCATREIGRRGSVVEQAAPAGGENVAAAGPVMNEVVRDAAGNEVARARKGGKG